MRILTITSTLMPDVNGQSIFTTNLMRELANRGHEIMVLVPARRNSEPVFLGTSVEITHSPSIDLGLFYRGLFISGPSHRFLVRILKKFNPDIIHLQDSSPICREAIKIARKQGIPTIGTHHSGPAVWAPYFTVKNQRLTEKFLTNLSWNWIISYLNRLDYIVVPSAASVQMLLGKGINVPVKRISCGVDLENFFPDRSPSEKEIRPEFGLGPSKITFLYVGRLDDEKAVELLIRSFISLQRTDMQLAIAGRGPLEKRLQDLSRESGQPGAIHFLGNIARQDLPRLINCADIFVMPSPVESFSISTIEAMACAKPILAANAQALPELVEHDGNGRLFIANQVDQLADELVWFAGHPDRWPAMGEASLRKAWDHKISSTIAAYESLYQAVIGKAVREFIPTSAAPSLRSWKELPPWVNFLLSNAWIPLLAGLLILLFTAGHQVESDPLPFGDLPKIFVNELREILQVIASRG